jgi:NifU-like protein
MYLSHAHELETYGPRAILHAAAPRGTAPLSRVDARGEAESADHTAWIQLELQLVPGTRRIRQASFRSGGPPVLVAAGSVLTQLLEGVTLGEARHLSPVDLEKLLGGVPVVRYPLLQVSIAALESALQNARDRREQRQRSAQRRRTRPQPPAVRLPALVSLREACGSQ